VLNKILFFGYFVTFRCLSTSLYYALDTVDSTCHAGFLRCIEFEAVFQVNYSTLCVSSYHIV